MVKVVLKYPDCPVCRALREVLPEDEVSDEVINDYHEGKGGYDQLFPKAYWEDIVDVLISVDE